MSYVRVRSVHVFRTFTRDGGAITRCGRRVLPPIAELEELPLDERSCETCLRLIRHDEDIQMTENDVVPEPGPEDATVPG
jgi:hypothetical protein